jgi:beta-galactosidase
LFLALAWLMTTPGMAVAGAAAKAPPGTRHAIGYDRYSLKIDGKRIAIWSGEFHYWRLPSPGLWRDVLEKMKAAGYDAVQIYFDWDYHSPAKGVYDFSGIRDVDALLDMARDAGIYVIARPGPYINAETDAGGFPGWLTTIKGKVRTPAPDYTADYRQWLTQIDRILARHQLTDGGGTVILYQVENEFYDDSPSGRQYMHDIEQKVRADGITVPLTGNHNATFQHGLGAVDLPGYDSYPLGFDCSRPGRWTSIYDYSRERIGLAGSPLFFPEFQGGSFDAWGADGYDACRRLTGADFERVFYEANIAAGATMQNFYMTYGGISWGQLASPGMYTSYDYGAAIDVDRRLTDKYYQQKRLGYLLATAQPLTKTERMAIKAPDNPGLRLDGRYNPDDGTRFYIRRHADATATGDDATHLLLDLSAPHSAQPAYTRVPQQAGTVLRIDGRDSKILLANYRFGHQQLVYSTSELMTDLVQNDQDVAVLYGRRGEDGETVLRYAARPEVEVLSGDVASTWDAARGTVRLNYRHAGLMRVRIGQGNRSLLLLIADDQATDPIWTFDTAAGPVLVLGPYLTRSARWTADQHGVLALSGDTDKRGPIEVFGDRTVTALSWNGRPLDTRRTASQSLAGELPGPQPVSLPSLAHWSYKAGAPEIAPAFDDAGWQRADTSHTDHPGWNGKLPILNADEYGFHHGAIWYRGHFTATGKEQGVILGASMGVHMGNVGVFTAWLNGHYLGSYPSGAQYFAIDPAYLAMGRDNVLSVLVDNMGHNEEEYPDAFKEARGLTDATLVGSTTSIAWRIQGTRGGESLVDPVRGPMNNGGLYGEREGWSLPGYPDQAWQSVSLPRHASGPGVDWYRTHFALDLPPGQDVPIALRIDDATPRHYRVLIFVNGWQLGRYIKGVGPQHVFSLPTGILDEHGENTIALAVWSTDGDGGIGSVSLSVQGNYLSALRVPQVRSPGYQDIVGQSPAPGGEAAH